MRQKLEQFMRGRYGVDKLNRFLVWAGIVVLIFFQLILNARELGFILTMAMLAICYFRMFSRNLQARYKENDAFLKVYNPIARKLRVKWKQLKDIRSYKYFTCPGCGQSLRIPRGKGNVSIRCSKCHHEFQGKT